MSILVEVTFYWSYFNFKRSHNVHSIHHLFGMAEKIKYSKDHLLVMTWRAPEGPDALLKRSLER